MNSFSHNKSPFRKNKSPFREKESFTRKGVLYAFLGHRSNSVFLHGVEWDRLIVHRTQLWFEHELALQNSRVTSHPAFRARRIVNIL